MAVTLSGRREVLCGWTIMSNHPNPNTHRCKWRTYSTVLAHLELCFQLRLQGLKPVRTPSNYDQFAACLSQPLGSCKANATACT